MQSYLPQPWRLTKPALSYLTELWQCITSIYNRFGKSGSSLAVTSLLTYFTNSFSPIVICKIVIDATRVSQFLEELIASYYHYDGQHPRHNILRQWPAQEALTTPWLASDPKQKAHLLQANNANLESIIEKFESSTNFFHDPDCRAIVGELRHHLENHNQPVQQLQQIIDHPSKTKKFNRTFIAINIVQLITTIAMAGFICHTIYQDNSGNKPEEKNFTSPYIGIHISTAMASAFSACVSSLIDAGKDLVNGYKFSSNSKLIRRDDNEQHHSYQRAEILYFKALLWLELIYAEENKRQTYLNSISNEADFRHVPYPMSTPTDAKMLEQYLKRLSQLAQRQISETYSHSVNRENYNTFTRENRNATTFQPHFPDDEV